jgi:hypothetical protein
MDKIRTAAAGDAEFLRRHPSGAAFIKEIA